MKNYPISLVVIAALLMSIGIIVPAFGLPLDADDISPIGNVTISAQLPDSPSDVVTYRVILDVQDTAYFSCNELEKIRANVTSEIDAPLVAQQILNNYGGLPQGAKLVYNATEYLERINLTTGGVEEKYPICTNIQYARSINDIPVVGPGGYIYIDLGNDGELLYLNKVWRTVSPDGNVSVIPVSTAIEKLQNGEVLNPKRYPYNVTVKKIRLGYYEMGRDEIQEYMEPAWLFKGTTDGGKDIQYYVYARRFANFTAAPTEVTKWQAVRFNDTSETNVTRWYWDFGDGTNSTEQSPSHLYRDSGNYTVNLTVWNDLGSDTISREDYVHVYYTGLAPVAHFSFNYTSGYACMSDPVTSTSPVTIQFIDQSEVVGKDTQWFWDFGDGTNSSEQNPIHTLTFREPETCDYYNCLRTDYTINLTVTDTFGRASSSLEDIPVFRDVRIDFAYEPASGDSPLLVNFTELPDQYPDWQVYYRLWDFGDGSTYEWTQEWDQNGSAIPPLKNIIHEYTSSGNYTVTLTKEDSDCAARYQKTKEFCVVVGESSNQPVADYTANITFGKEPLAVAFTDQSAHSPTGWTWSFGDGATSAEKDPEHVYSSAGIYTVSLKVSNDDGNDTENKSDYIHVYPSTPPLADFAANQTSGYSPFPVAFTDVSENGPVNWTWDFGDGTYAAEKDPEHTFAAPGNYTVSLFVMNDEGGNSTIKIDYIRVVFELPPIIDESKVAPVSGFTSDTTRGKAPLAVAFNDTTVFYPHNWNWSFGDGAISADQDPEHIYAEPGTYTVSLTTGNEYGENLTIKTDYITVLPVTLPDAGFTATPTAGKPPLSVTFNDTSNGSPTAWYWDFGDGITSTEQDPVHEYEAPGTYTVSLQVTNEDGSDTETKPDLIVVAPVILPVAVFSANTTTGNAPLAVRFTDESTGSPESWYWTFGDGATSDEQNPEHIYTGTGIYSVSLDVSNTDGNNTTTKTDYITVVTNVPPPVANFYCRPTYGKAPLAVKFTDTSTGSPTGWYWDFGDDTNATEQNPVHIYTSAGKYTVSLTTSNAGGSSTKTRIGYITVKGTPPPTANFYGKPTYGKAPLTVKFTDTSTGSPTGWFWDFGDGSDDTVQHPVHSYASAGKYTVSLTASDAAGSTTKTRLQYITVKSGTPTPTPTCTPSQCEPHETPQVSGTTEDGKIRLDWDVIINPCLQGYKVVISKNNPAPKYPDDGYMFWITDRNRNYAIISSSDHYNGGDFGGYLQTGESYYFSITAVYSDAKVPGNVISLTYPGIL